MKAVHRFAALFLALALTAALLTGCHVTSPLDPEFQEDWDQSMEEFSEDWDQSMEEFQESWDQSMEESQADWQEFWDGWDGKDTDGAKKHRWEIQNAAGEALYTIDAAESVEALDELLSGNEEDTWKLTGEEPGEAACSYLYSQEKTLLAGQDPDAERDYQNLMRFTVSAEKDIVTMTILEEAGVVLPGLDLSEFLTFHASVPAETAEALRNPEQFAE